ncbi:LacI family DNA-binding transcriptional regulator [Coraliomargarita sp. SDUM461004]|uniref:LacI family DNA-binding transcriptional regulator n=1 Tax=Thalassobacterium sedimentorum TaxID=3041258 RepID=A0ABU1AE54_9BACT|nr:LacI family DNA-binding transcriptional regulator [Coraliomargarita sp. SDUM461004]MDQ8192958.1 LacI family DNA-binding transcriptional regulator [Coraliomargarita sp. SDUM461004]
MEKVRIEDVARIAKVSRATVSRVINGSFLVEVDTKERVRRAMERVGYVPSLRRPGPKPKLGRTPQLENGTIALIIIGATSHLLQEPIMISVIDKLQMACRARQLNLLLDQMSSVKDIPHCVHSCQMDGAILMVAERLDSQREAIARLAEILPCVQLFTPGHPVDTVDHATTNDVAVGAMAYHALAELGCRQFVAVSANHDFHEALLVRGRAFLDRAQDQGFSTVSFAKMMSHGRAERMWPSPLSVFEQIAEVAAAVRQMAATSAGPVGVFLTLEDYALELHHALCREHLLQDGLVYLVVAGATQHYVGGLVPRPVLIDLCFQEIICTSVDRLIYRALNLPSDRITLMVAPKLMDCA